MYCVCGGRERQRLPSLKGSGRGGKDAKEREMVVARCGRGHDGCVWVGRSAHRIKPQLTSNHKPDKKGGDANGHEGDQTIWRSIREDPLVWYIQKRNTISRLGVVCNTREITPKSVECTVCVRAAVTGNTDKNEGSLRNVHRRHASKQKG